ncbi:MAG: hypothetical protein M3162_07065 [Thermoproteota archaeon]|nr:hypothetical protein [Thermoproteota archaeon]
MNHADIPSIAELNNKPRDERINTYRRFFADLRLTRLYFHISMLKYFAGAEGPKDEIRTQLHNNIVYLDQMDRWLDELKRYGNFEEFKKTCFDEIKAVDQIIKTYENRMRMSG